MFCSNDARVSVSDLHHRGGKSSASRLLAKPAERFSSLDRTGNPRYFGSIL